MGESVGMVLQGEEKGPRIKILLTSFSKTSRKERRAWETTELNKWEDDATLNSFRWGNSGQKALMVAVSEEVTSPAEREGRNIRESLCKEQVNRPSDGLRVCVLTLPEHHHPFSQAKYTYLFFRVRFPLEITSDCKCTQ